MFKVEYICFNIASVCNMMCPYCFRTDSKVDIISYTDAQKCIDFLVDNGCKTINITGGEPLCNPDWENIVYYSKKKGLQVVLSTNGLLLNMDNPILNYVDVLTIPLDGDKEEINSLTRDKGHFEKIKSIIEEYAQNNYVFKLKINTVITKYNMDNLFQIYDLINRKNVIWKLFQYRSKGKNNKFPLNKVLTNCEIKELIKSINFDNAKAQIVYLDNDEDRMFDFSDNNYHILLNPAGDIICSYPDHDLYLFNILSLQDYSEDDVYTMLNNPSWRKYL